MYILNDLLKKVVDKQGSDLHLSVGTPPRIRKNGLLVPIDGEKLSPGNLKSVLKDHLNSERLERLNQGEEIGIIPAIGTSFQYYKTKSGYRIEQMVHNKIDLDVKYHWDIITNLLNKFQLEDWTKKNPPLTLIDIHQKTLMEFV